MSKIISALIGGAIAIILAPALFAFARETGLVPAGMPPLDPLLWIGTAMFWVLPVIAGWLPRRLLLGKARPVGVKLVLFELLRAMAISWPLLVLVWHDPEYAIGALLLAAGSSSAIYGLRITAGRLIGSRAAVRQAIFGPTGKTRPQATSLRGLQRVNSALILICALVPGIATLLALTVGGPLISWILPVIALPVASFFLCILGYRYSIQELDSIYDDHLETFIRLSRKSGCVDLIHFAGGSTTALATIAKRLTAGGLSPIVLARDASSYERSVKLGLRAVLARSISDLDRILLPSVRRLHYVDNTLRAGHTVRFSKVAHILHIQEIPGSDTAFPEYLAMYDRIAASGPSWKQVREAEKIGVTLLDSGTSKAEPYPAALVKEKGNAS